MKTVVPLKVGDYLHLDVINAWSRFGNNASAKLGDTSFDNYKMMCSASGEKNQHRKILEIKGDHVFIEKSVRSIRYTGLSTFNAFFPF